MEILSTLIIESEMKVTYLKWLLKYFVSLFQSIYEHNVRLFSKDICIFCGHLPQEFVLIW